MLESTLARILTKIYSVESETFHNYKFKDVTRVFDEMQDQLSKLHVLDLMP